MGAGTVEGVQVGVGDVPHQNPIIIAAAAAAAAAAPECRPGCSACSRRDDGSSKCS